MKKRLRTLTAFFLVVVLCTAHAYSQIKKETKANPDKAYEETMKRTQWFREARFGMFIHWGLYSIPARGEWVRTNDKILPEKYHEYLNEFNPVDFNPKEWAKAAKEAGMKYAVMTAKHHDGFCMFDSKLTDFKATNSPAKRDLIKEYIEAFRNEGLKVGLYYSLLDWDHADYPTFGDQFHPMRDNPDFKAKEKDKDFKRYLDYMHGQVKELVTNYGKIDIMWFDFSYGPMSREKWKAEELIKMVRSYQPDIILDNRLGRHEAGKADGEALGDFETPEQGIPSKMKVNNEGNILPWETCLTMNNSWGYSAGDKEWKTGEQIILALVNCVSKNGNLLLNVGPDAKGNIPKESYKVLGEVGTWMKLNGKSIYGCGAASLPKPEFGRFTQNGKFLYAHITEPIIGQVYLEGYKDKVKKARVLRDGSEAYSVVTWWGDTEATTGSYFVNIGNPTHNTYKMPDPIDTVIEIELK